MKTNHSQQQIYLAKKEIVRAQVQRFRDFYKSYFNEKETAKMVNYFFDKVYDLDGKEEWLELAMNTFARVKNLIKEQTKKNVEKLIDLNNLTDTLDHEMAILLLNEGWDQQIKLNRKEYDDLFRKFGKWLKRKEQLKIVLHNMRLFYELSHRPVNNVIMKPAKLMSKVLGVYPLFASVEEGYYAVLPVHKEIFEQFYDDVKNKEWTYLQEIFPELANESI